jgi:hypothetical protein
MHNSDLVCPDFRSDSKEFLDSDCETGLSSEDDRETMNVGNTTMVFSFLLI